MTTTLSATERQLVVDILMDARDRIFSPNHWTKFTRARTHDGQRVEAFSPRADRWCAVGTLARSTILTQFAMKNRVYEWAWHYMGQAAFQVYESVKGRPFPGDKDFALAPSYINDYLGHDSTLEMFDIAIRMAKDAC